MLEDINGQVSEAFNICSYYEWNNWHKSLTIGGEEEGHCGCGVDVIHGGIPHGGACPLARGAHGGGGQYLWPEGVGGVLELWPGWPAGGGGGQYPPGGGATTSEAARLRETLPMASQVVGPYENPVT
jgi:hypothetical protein